MWSGFKMIYNKTFTVHRGLKLSIMLIIILASSFVSFASEGNNTDDPNRDRIKIYPANKRYWQYRQEPILLIGGSVTDNLFHIPNLKEHLDLLKSVGGNYVRCTMSPGDDDVQPFKKVGDKYDLDKWNPEYWQRFERFLKLTSQRDIIVQIEVWATFSYYRDSWAENAFNPKNNTNYTADESGLPVEVDSHPTRCENNFFWSVPAERNQQIVLKFQQRFVDNILSYSLNFPNVLYCMDNETSVTPEWGKYWSQYIKAKADRAGLIVQTTEMWDPWDLSHKMHNATFNHPEIYSFVDISQNNHQKGQPHWDNAQKQRRRTSKNPRPLNNVKIYGADTGRYGSDRDGTERFWRNIIGGLASARFHRPDSGLGLGEKVQAHIKSARMLADKFDFFNAGPDSDSSHLLERDSNEAYLSFVKGSQYTVYFTNGGAVLLDLINADGDFTLQWLDIENTKWLNPQTVKAPGKINLTAPKTGHFAALLTKQSPSPQ
jgi:hypothetical protein